ncbi:hypothetical protein T492DRAFT_974175 [Pavlovales sp. CCMP2436]|nr:hypothetical protein T492DRAFT_974175 [Pavlovales sp. CCMP2436]
MACAHCTLLGPLHPPLAPLRLTAPDNASLLAGARGYCRDGPAGARCARNPRWASRADLEYWLWIHGRAGPQNCSASHALPREREPSCA